MKIILITLKKFRLKAGFLFFMLIYKQHYLLNYCKQNVKKLNKKSYHM